MSRNDAPPGGLEDKWTARWMRIALEVASWSKDPERKVGAVIVDDSRIVMGLGYNGFPRGVEDSEERLNDEATKLKLVVHAEANAILNSHDLGAAYTTLYCTSHPCSECAKLIVQRGIACVVSPAAKTEGKWAEDAKFARIILSEGGVEHEIIYKDRLERIIADE